MLRDVLTLKNNGSREGSVLDEKLPRITCILAI